MRTETGIPFDVRYLSNTGCNEQKQPNWPDWPDYAKSMETVPVCIHAASVVLDGDSSNTSTLTTRQIGRVMTNVFDQRRTNMKTANRAGAEVSC